MPLLCYKLALWRIVQQDDLLVVMSPINSISESMSCPNFKLGKRVKSIGGQNDSSLLALLNDVFVCHATRESTLIRGPPVCSFAVLLHPPVLLQHCFMPFAWAVLPRDAQRQALGEQELLGRRCQEAVLPLTETELVYSLMEDVHNFHICNKFSFT